MTTLHGLVTISELFVGFNLINTGVVNCLIMCQNARKMHHSEAKKIQKFSGEVWAQPPPQFPPHWGGDIPWLNPPPRRLRRLSTRAFGARPGPRTKILFIRQCPYLFYRSPFLEDKGHTRYYSCRSAGADPGGTVR